MRKSLLLTGASFFLLSLASSAQITNGSVLLGGGISGGRSTVENNNQENKYSSFSVYPSIGLAVKENTVVGLRLTYSHSKSAPANNPYTQEQKGYGAGLFYRKYMPWASSSICLARALPITVTVSRQTHCRTIP